MYQICIKYIKAPKGFIKKNCMHIKWEARSFDKSLIRNTLCNNQQTECWKEKSFTQWRGNSRTILGGESSLETFLILRSAFIGKLSHCPFTLIQNQPHLEIPKLQSSFSVLHTLHFALMKLAQENVMVSGQLLLSRTVSKKGKTAVRRSTRDQFGKQCLHHRKTN